MIIHLTKLANERESAVAMWRRVSMKMSLLWALAAIAFASALILCLYN